MDALPRRTVLQIITGLICWPFEYLLKHRPKPTQPNNLVDDEPPSWRNPFDKLAPWKELRRKMADEKAAVLLNAPYEWVCQELAEIERWDPEMCEWVQDNMLRLARKRDGEPEPMTHYASCNSYAYYCPAVNYLEWEGDLDPRDRKAAACDIALQMMTSNAPGWVRRCWNEYINCHSTELNQESIEVMHQIAHFLEANDSVLLKNDAEGQGVIQWTGLHGDAKVIYAQDMYYTRRLGDIARSLFHIGGALRLTVVCGGERKGCTATYYLAYACQRRKALTHLAQIACESNNAKFTKSLNDLSQHWCSPNFHDTVFSWGSLSLV